VEPATAAVEATASTMETATATMETTASTMETTTATMETTAATTMAAALCKKRFSRQPERQRHDHRAENFQKGTFTHGSNSGRAPRCPKRISFYTRFVTSVVATSLRRSEPDGRDLKSRSCQLAVKPLEPSKAGLSS
jgi:hypothetical protein